MGVGSREGEFQHGLVLRPRVLHAHHDLPPRKGRVLAHRDDRALRPAQHLQTDRAEQETGDRTVPARPQNHHRGLCAPLRQGVRGPLPDLLGGHRNPRVPGLCQIRGGTEHLGCMALRSGRLRSTRGHVRRRGAPGIQQMEREAPGRGLLGAPEHGRHAVPRVVQSYDHRAAHDAPPRTRCPHGRRCLAPSSPAWPERRRPGMSHSAPIARPVRPGRREETAVPVV